VDGIAVIEDASQALGAARDGRPLGTHATATVFSVGPNKVVDAGEGGVLVTDSPVIHRAAVRATQHPVRQLLTGIDEITELALAARVHPFAAVLGLHALDTLEERLREREQRAQEQLARVGGGIAVPTPAAGERFSWPGVPVRLMPDAGLALAASPLGTRLIAPLLGQESSSTPIAAEQAGEWYVLATRTRAG
jgi:dTDP-4-amino-4,6-dideoxygalactose transaminase